MRRVREKGAGREGCGKRRERDEKGAGGEGSGKRREREEKGGGREGCGKRRVHLQKNARTQESILQNVKPRNS
jgi:hypothetical protein